MDKTAATPKFVDRNEIARMLDVSPLTVSRMAWEGKIPSIKFGRNRRYDPEAVLKALEDASTERA